MMRMLFCALLVLVSGCVGGSLTTTGSGIMYDKDGKPMGIPLVQHCILGEQTKDLDGSTWETKGCSWDGATGMLSVKQVRKP
jgi:hypothetical protein